MAAVAMQDPAEPGYDVEKVSFLDRAYELSMAQFLALLANGENAIILFYKPGCPWCKMMELDYRELAKKIHSTNLKEYAQPIVVAQIDGDANREAINRQKPGFFGGKSGRGFPTIMFKSASGSAKIVDPGELRTLANLSRLAGEYFGDESLIPMEESLYKLMKNPDPDLVYYYVDNVSIIPRFVLPLNENYVDPRDAVRSLGFFFMMHPEIMRTGAAFPVDELDRADVPVPTIKFRGDKKEYKHRDAVRRIKEKYGLSQ